MPEKPPDDYEIGLTTINLSDKIPPVGAEAQDLPETAETRSIRATELTWPDRDASLVLIHGPRSRRFRLVPPGPLVLGRDEGCDVELDWPSVSRRHAEVILSEHAVTIRDLGSTNGTEVNGVTVQEQQLRDGDQVTIGQVLLRFMGQGVQECNHRDLLYQRTKHDSTTTTYSMRHLLQIMEREASRSQRYDRPFCLLALGIDGLKALNQRDNTAGIQVMRQLALMVRNNIRRADSLARLNQNELAVVLPELELAGARSLGRKLCELVDNSVFVVGQETLKVTISVGLAAHDTSSCDPSLVLCSANEQLLAARRKGGNIVAA